MPFPNLAGKHAYDAFFSPQDFIADLQRQGRWEGFPLPVGVIFVYSRRLLERMLARWPVAHEQRGRLAGEFHLLRSGGELVGVSAGFGIGAPAVTTVMEELIALGVRQFLSIGAAGGLQADLAIGDLVVCDRAIRDEGVSHHYLPPDKYAYPTAALTARLHQQLSLSSNRARVGTTWTIDAPYRETVEELRHYQAEGVLTVEMEAAALAAVAQFRGVQFATAFAISDSLAELTWNPQFGAEATVQGLDRLSEASVAMLAGG